MLIAVLKLVARFLKMIYAQVLELGLTKHNITIITRQYESV